MSGNSPASIYDRLQVLAGYLPQFESPGFEFGHWHESVTTSAGVLTLPYFTEGPVGAAFIRSAYDANWVLQKFDWGEWQRSPEAIRLRDDPAALERATAEQLARLITVLIRQDRFVEGALDDAFTSGLLTAILRRAAVLANEVGEKQA